MANLIAYGLNGSMHIILRKDDLIHVVIKNHNSWIVKNILKQRDNLGDFNITWVGLQGNSRFCMKEMYRKLCTDDPKVPWYNLLYHSLARPRALITLWLACHGRLSTKARLKKFGLIDNAECCFCQEEETQNHLLFGCEELGRI